MLVPFNLRTYRIAIFNGIVSMVGLRLADEGTIIPLIMHRLTGMAWVVGVTLGLCVIARTIAQIVVARRLDTLAYKKPTYIISAIVRCLALVGTGAALFWAESIGLRVAAALVLVGVLARSVGGAYANLGFTDMVAKAVPTTKRGSLWLWRRVIGLAIAGAVVTPMVRYLVGPTSPFPFPVNFAILFTSAAGIMSVAWLIFSTVEEPPSHASSRQLALRAHLVRGWRMLKRDAGYRRLIRTRLALGFAGAIRPFFIVFASKVWGLGDEVVATFMAVQIGAEVLAAIMTGRMSDRLGNRSVLLVSSMALTVSALVAVGAAFGEWNFPLSIGPWTINAQVALLSVAFGAGGFYLSSLTIGSMNYMMDIAPERKRPSYLAFMGLFTLPMALAPMAYGWAADALGYRVVFTTGLVLAAAAFYFATQLLEPRDELADGDLEAYT